jgi:hypothetical protein
LGFNEFLNTRIYKTKKEEEEEAININKAFTPIQLFRQL